MPLVCVDVMRSCFVVAGEQKRNQKSSFFMTPCTHRAYECTMYSSRVVVHRTKVQYSAPTRLASDAPMSQEKLSPENSVMATII